MTTALDTLNPFRYRGYVYDEETGLYYLRNRYYNPEWGRFINADTVLGQAGALLSHNLFAYCGNRPIMSYDPTGEIILPFNRVGIVSNWIHERIDKELAKHKNVNDVEKTYAHSNVWNSFVGFTCATRADALGKAIFGKDWEVDDIDANAFRHCVWNIILTQELGVKVADIIATNHEAGQIGTIWNDNAKMDLYNNQVGRLIGESYTIFDVSRFVDSSNYTAFLQKYPQLKAFMLVDIYPAYLAMQALENHQLQVNKLR